jgi:hypothetical protein
MVEMQLGCPDAELTQYLFDALVDCGVVGAVASDEFFDNRAYRSGCQQPMENEHQPTSSGGGTPKVVVTTMETIVREFPRAPATKLDHLGFCFPFADCSCFSAFCFLFLSFSFLPPLSPILDSSLVEIVERVRSRQLSPLGSAMSNPTSTLPREKSPPATGPCFTGAHRHVHSRKPKGRRTQPDIEMLGPCRGENAT